MSNSIARDYYVLYSIWEIWLVSDLPLGFPQLHLGPFLVNFYLFPLYIFIVIEVFLASSANSLPLLSVCLGTLQSITALNVKFVT